jgi:hypothetical protein
VRGADHVRQREQRVVCGERLGIDDVDPRAGQASVLQGPDERLLVDDRSSGDVDEEGARFHQREPVAVEQAAGLVRQRAGDDHEVGVAQEVLQRDVRHSFFGDRRPLGHEHPQLPRPQQADGLAPDAAVADHAQGAAGQAGALRAEAVSAPVALVQRPVALAEPVGEREHERDRRRRHRPGDSGRRDRHRDAALRAGPDVEKVEADAVPGDDRQALDAVERRRRQRSGVVVEAVDVRERVRRQRVVLEELPLDSRVVERREVERRKGERAVRPPHVARDADPERGVSVIGHAV